MIPTSDFLTAQQCTKYVFGRRPRWGAYSAPSNPLPGLKRPYIYGEGRRRKAVEEAMGR